MNQLINIQRIILCSAISLLLCISFNCSLSFAIDQFKHLNHDHGVHESSADNQDYKHSHKHRHSNKEKEHEHKHFNTAFVNEVIVREKSSIEIVHITFAIQNVFHLTSLESDSFTIEILRPPIFS